MAIFGGLRRSRIVESIKGAGGCCANNGAAATSHAEKTAAIAIACLERVLAGITLEQCTAPRFYPL